MLPKKNRLGKKNEIDFVKKQGKAFKAKDFTFLYLISREKESRFAFVVSTKISKKAVVRNRVKRFLKGSVSKILPQLKENIDGVFLTKSVILESSREEIENEISDSFQKEGLLK